MMMGMVHGLMGEWRLEKQVGGSVAIVMVVTAVFVVVMMQAMVGVVVMIVAVMVWMKSYLWPANHMTTDDPATDFIELKTACHNDGQRQRDTTQRRQRISHSIITTLTKTNRNRSPPTPWYCSRVNQTDDKRESSLHNS